MKKKVSRTANTVAAVRAKHALYDNCRIFNDSLAIELTSPFWRLICNKKWMAKLVFENILASLWPVQITVLCRARFAEEAVNRAIRKGAEQYLILGAGLDSFALRRTDIMSRVHVWEVDQSDTQVNKIEKIKARKLYIPENLTFIPVDFNKQELSTALFVAGFNFHSKTIVSMLGFSYYLDKPGLFNTIQSVASHFAIGTELIIDIRVLRTMIDKSYLHRYKKTEKFTAFQGEKMITEFRPEEFSAEMLQYGFELVDELSPEEQTNRYITNKSNYPPPSPEVYFFHFKLR